MHYDIRPFASIEEHEQAGEIQLQVWAGDAPVQSHITSTIQRHGGIVLGAFLPDGKMIGFVLSFLSPAHHHEYGPEPIKGLSQHSHMAGVLPEYQGKGIGEKLKLAQANETRRRGMNLMTWTYDPLETRNGWLNINKLGAIVRTYIPNCYGAMTDALNRGLPSDRFEPEWWLTPESRDYFDHTRSNDRFEVEVSPNFQALKKNDPEAALDLRLNTRKSFMVAFAEGYVVTHMTKRHEHIYYVLHKFKV
jgi:predicted GNAT superfamily acetyltransferase